MWLYCRFWDVIFLSLPLYCLGKLWWTVFCQLNKLTVDFIGRRYAWSQIWIFRAVVSGLRSNYRRMVTNLELLTCLKVLLWFFALCRIIILRFWFKLNLFDLLPGRLSSKNLLFWILPLNLVGCRSSIVAQKKLIMLSLPDTALHYLALVTVMPVPIDNKPTCWMTRFLHLNRSCGSFHLNWIISKSI